MEEPYYSPTVRQAYEENPRWWEDYGGDRGCGYDYDRYDRYGFDREGFDRAGFRAEQYGDQKAALARLRSARAVGSSLASRMARRIPAAASRAIVEHTLSLLGERFPELPVIRDPITADDDEVGPALKTGVNSVNDLYAGAYFRNQGYFSVIAERRGKEAEWTATILSQAGRDSDVRERSVAAESIESLMEEVAKDLAAFRPCTESYVIYMSAADTPDACFGAMPEWKWNKLDEASLPGDRVGAVKAESAEDALRGFASGPRSGGFAEMIERGLARLRDHDGGGVAPGIR